MRIERPLIAAPTLPQAPRVTATTPGGLEPAPPASGPSRSFGKLLQESVEEVNRLQLEADTYAERVSTGQVEDLHTAMISLHKASLALDLTIQVRNKAIEAYQEIMRMQF